MQNTNFMKNLLLILVLFYSASIAYCNDPKKDNSYTSLLKNFQNPPDSARPGVYWYFMDGNMSKEGMTADLESMKAVGIGNVLFLEVNVGVPRGKVDLLSDQWQNLFVHAVREAERLGITITLGVGPGWSGSGGPWVSGHQSMQHLVASSTQITSKTKSPIILPKPLNRSPYFGEKGLGVELIEKRTNYYEDVAVLAFPSPEDSARVIDIDEKALYYRAPYTSRPGTKQFLPTQLNYNEPRESAIIKQRNLIDITRFMKPDGTLDWKAPKGNWTIMRFGSRNNGAITRPAPLPGLGFEADKFDTTAINDHLANFTGKLFKRTGIPDKNKAGGLKSLHMDSWEMGSQNWTPNFRAEFIKRRGYDPLPFYPVYTGLILESLENSERFLWDLRLTSQELVIENHAQHLKKYGKKYNLNFSIEPYDMNPTADMELGAVADIPMCEFWSWDYGFNASFSCIQAASIAHINGASVVAAESFTAGYDAWKKYPGTMKNQGDWAFASGVNKFVYHTFQHQFLNDSLKPGATMGPYGVHWDRNQTWWPMVDGYHRYITRCQYTLQQGQSVADILYLTPEGAPHVFRAPASALTGEEPMPDRRSYNFDGCSPSQIMTAKVEGHKIVFPSGAAYSLMVLPNSHTITPVLLAKIESLVSEGAIIIGNPPRKSPSLVNYPDCDQEVGLKALMLWGKFDAPQEVTKISVDKGNIYWGGAFSNLKTSELYPDYEVTIKILKDLSLKPDFETTGPVRYTHRKLDGNDIYFVANKSNGAIDPILTFRSEGGKTELWNPMTGTSKELTEIKKLDNQVQIPIHFEPYESFFVVFNPQLKQEKLVTKNYTTPKLLEEIQKPWSVSFDPKWGGPKNIIFDKLQDWSTNSLPGIKYYSGIATYRNTFNLKESQIKNAKQELILKLGEVMNMARVRVNGKDLGVVWTAPFQVNISDAVLEGVNQVEIEVANLWSNRLIGDDQYPDDGIVGKEWPEWLTQNKPRTSGRYTFTTFKYYKKEMDLLKSGLLGPVQILTKP